MGTLTKCERIRRECEDRGWKIEDSVEFNRGNEMADLPEIRLTPITSDSQKAVGTKLGGEPEWIQVEWRPECCGKPMVYLAQIDSLDIPQAKLPDSAIVYLFFCPKCFETTSQMQCC